MCVSKGQKLIQVQDASRRALPNQAVVHGSGSVRGSAGPTVAGLKIRRNAGDAGIGIASRSEVEGAGCASGPENRVHAARGVGGPASLLNSVSSDRYRGDESGGVQLNNTLRAGMPQQRVRKRIRLWQRIES